MEWNDINSFIIRQKYYFLFVLANYKVDKLERQKRKVLQYTMASYMDKIEKRKFVREFEDILEFIESIRVTY